MALEASVTATITFGRVIPVLRIFDLAKADQFYLDYLGFHVDWDHRFDDNSPLYRQIPRGDLILHLSEHHGDASPAAHVRVTMRGIEAFHKNSPPKITVTCIPAWRGCLGTPLRQE